MDSEQAHTSFGKLPLSVEKSQAQFSFPHANRWDGCKKFDAELTKTENIGKNAPGPQYMYDDKIKYAEVSFDRILLVFALSNSQMVHGEVFVFWTTMKRLLSKMQ